MELQQAILGRRSIRGFLSDSVSREDIQDLVEKAKWCPSWGNTQPYEIYVAMGEKVEEFKKQNVEAFLGGTASETEIPTPAEWPDLLKARYKDVGRQVLDSQNIGRKDMERRTEYYKAMFTAFNAPVFAFFTIDKRLLVEYSLLDVGLFLQTFCVLAHEKGLGTCIMAASVTYPEIVREVMSISDDKRLVIGVGLGYPDLKNNVNVFKRNRAPLEEILHWVD